GVFVQHVVVINQRSAPAMVLLVEFGDVKTASSLLGFQTVHRLLGRWHPRIIRVKRDKIGKGANGLSGNALVIFRAFGLFVVGLPDLVECVRADFFIGVAVSRPLVGLGGRRIILYKPLFLRASNIDLGH